MRRTFLVAGHEFLRHVCRPSFLLTTILLPLIAGAILLFTRGGPVTGTDGPSAPAPGAGESVGYVDQSGLLAGGMPDDASNLPAFPDEAAAQAALREDAIAGYYLLPADYLAGGTVAWVSEGTTGPEGGVAMRALLRSALLRDEPAVAERLVAEPTIRFVPVGASGEGSAGAPGSEEERGPVAFWLPYTFATLLYVTIFSSAGFLLQSVTEEKENRTIEIVLTSLRPLQLLVGKVVGLGLLGLVQVSVWLAAGLLLLRLGGVHLPVGALTTVPWAVVALAVVSFVLGYLVYGSLLAAVDATVTNVREGSQLTALLVIPCIIPLWFLSAIIERPDGLLATVLSLFPLTAPITLMIRATLTAIAPWQIAASIAVLAASAGLALWLAARLFRAGALLAGQRLSPGAVLRALRAG